MNIGGNHWLHGCAFFHIWVVVVEHRGYSVKVTVWDTAGQERYRNMTEAYYRGAQGVVLVYDIADRRSFEQIGAWLGDEEQHNGAGASVKLLVGNKRDLWGCREVEHAESDDEEQMDCVAGVFQRVNLDVESALGGTNQS